VNPIRLDPYHFLESGSDGDPAYFRDQTTAAIKMSISYLGKKVFLLSCFVLTLFSVFKLWLDIFSKIREYEIGSRSSFFSRNLIRSNRTGGYAMSN
jgi:hypothetical protein